MIDLNMDIYELGLTSKTLRALNSNNIFTIADLVCLTHNDLLQMKYVGQNIYNDIMGALKRNHLHLGIKKDF